MATIRKRRWTAKTGDIKTSWQVDYVDQRGKRRRKQFERKKEADSFLVQARGEVAAGIHTVDRESISVAEAADKWLEACKVGRDGRDPIEPTTARTYQEHAELHIKPLIGNELLSRLTTPRVIEFRDELLRTRSRAMARKALTSFKSILTEAQSRGLVTQNVALPVKIVSGGRHKKEVRIPTKMEVREILNLAERKSKDGRRDFAKKWHRYHALLATAAFTGMRASELRGLYWEHVDLEGRFIRVKQRADHDGIIGSVKSPAGRRSIPLSAGLVSLLRTWRLACPPGELVFPNWKGNVELHRNFLERCWWPICRECGFAEAGGRPWYGFHHLRHFRASMLIESGASPKEIMVEMGHSSIQMTFDVYGHLFPDTGKGMVRADRIESELMG